MRPAPISAERQGQRQHADQHSGGAHEQVAGVVHRVVEGAAARAGLAVAAHERHGHRGVVRAEAQVADLRAQPADLDRHQVQPAPETLRLRVGVGRLEPAQQAGALGPRRGQRDPGRSRAGASRPVPTGSASGPWRVPSRSRRAGRSRAAGYAQVEVAAGAVLAGAERRAEHEAAVAVGDRGHPLGQPLHLVHRRSQLERHRALDLAIAATGREAPAGGAGATGGVGAALGRRRGL